MLPALYATLGIGGVTLLALVASIVLFWRLQVENAKAIDRLSRRLEDSTSKIIKQVNRKDTSKVPDVELRDDRTLWMEELERAKHDKL